LRDRDFDREIGCENDKKWAERKTEKGSYLMSKEVMLKWDRETKTRLTGGICQKGLSLLFPI